MKPRDGGAAFPCGNGDPRDGKAGMSLRDYFAGQALTGVLQARALINGGDSLNSQENIAEEAYEIADAMIEAREKETETT